MENSNSAKTQTIARNSLFLYLRLGLSIIIGLLTSRLILKALGVVDFGVYNVVGGVSTMFVFLNSTMSVSTSRYVAFALGNKDFHKLKTIYSQAKIKGEDITIYGNGQQTRSFQYIDDLLEAMIRMMNTSDDFIGPVNTGNPGEFSMLELAEKVISLTGSKSKIVFKPLPGDDPKQRKPDITLAKSKLDGWEPKVQLEEGLTKTIEYFKKFV